MTTFKLLVSVASLAYFAAAAIPGQSDASSPFNPCPRKCSEAGRDPIKWTHLHGERALTRCEEPTLFDLQVHNPIRDPNTHFTIRACTASNKDTSHKIEYDPTPWAFGEPKGDKRRRAVSPAFSNSTLPTKEIKGCRRGAKTHRNSTKPTFLQWDSNSLEKTDRAPISLVNSAASKIEEWLQDGTDCETSVMFARAGDAVVGVYVGNQVHKPSAAKLVRKFLDGIKDAQSGRLAMQVCGSKSPSSWMFGVFAERHGDIAEAQDIVRRWSLAECLSGAEFEASQSGAVDVEMVDALDIPVAALETVPTLARRSPLEKRADCVPMLVEPGDSCWSMAQKCKITETQLKRYNKGGADFCDATNFKFGVHLCCTEGTLPDMSPQPDGDGNCVVGTITPTTLCDHFMRTYFVTEEQLDERNKKTWGWLGCRALQPNQKICLSKGEPPMPAPIDNAVCGPQTPGVIREPGKDLADHKPCPLNVCCNIWGQCGLTEEFCTVAPGKTGAPGTSEPGKNSCISNCEREITNNKIPPLEFGHIAYFEAWNKNRPCLHMDVTDIDTKKYTHIHFSFIDITPDFQIDYSKVADQFEKMKGMTGIKKIASFGGWAFSTEAPTYNIFRQATTPAHRETLAQNMLKFANDHGLDGLDFDWEYPAAPDLPEIPPGIKEEGENYLEFLKRIKFLMGRRSVSIAAPASYWYLKGYPIKEIGNVVDYMVYMTYDLHGQWDYGNKWSSPGCKTGDCLRSHVNITETTDALVMVTKAGVRSDKIYVGIASYGRSFKMAEAGCWGPDCRFTGTANRSDAAPGICTETGGYISSAEIREIKRRATDPNWGGYVITKEYHDHASNSDILVYDETEWVAWMNDVTKSTRIEWYKSLNFGGVSDWAVDLDKDYGEDSIGDEGPIKYYESPECDWKKQYNDLAAIENDKSIPSYCLAYYTLEVLLKMIDRAMDKYNDVNNGYDDKFASYKKAMQKSLPEMLNNWMYFRDWDNKMHGDGQKYFDCKFRGNGKTYEGACPTPEHILGNTDLGIWSLELTLRDSDGFDEGLMKDLGIARDWIKWGEFKDERRCQPTVQPTMCLGWEMTYKGIPQLKDDFSLPDPKKIITDTIPKLDSLRTKIVAAMGDIMLGMSMAADVDFTNVFTMPVFMLAQGVDSMEEAKKIGEDIQKQERDALIWTIVSAVLFFVPVVGQLGAAAAGLASLARVFAAIGAAGGAAMTIVDIVQNPESAPMAIASMLMGGKIKTKKDFSDFSIARGKMTPSIKEGIGKTFKGHDDKYQNIMKRTCR